MTQRCKGRDTYRASITREPFLFYEMRTTARLMSEGLLDEEILCRISEENLFQYPTEKSVRKIAKACIHRLHGLEDECLVQAIVNQPQDVSKQICLYAMMRQERLLCDFMLTVIGEKYRQQDFTFSKLEPNVFFLRLQEQDDNVATWSESTITKIKQVFMRILVDTEYLDDLKSDHLNPVLLNKSLENAIRENNDDAMLPALNCFA